MTLFSSCVVAILYNLQAVLILLCIMEILESRISKHLSIPHAIAWAIPSDYYASMADKKMYAHA